MTLKNSVACGVTCGAASMVTQSLHWLSSLAAQALMAVIIAAVGFLTTRLLSHLFPKNKS